MTVRGKTIGPKNQGLGLSISQTMSRTVYLEDLQKSKRETSSESSGWAFVMR